MKKFLENIYYHLPVTFQNVAISLFGYFWFRRRFGGKFNEEVQASMERDKFTKEQWHEYETKRLRSILTHSYRTVPYYRDLFTSNGFTESDMMSFQIENISKLPTLDKATFKRFGATTMLSDKLEANGEFLFSSGSTGTPTQILYSHRMHQEYFSVFETRINYWASLDYKVPRGVIGGRRIIREGVNKGPFYRYNIFEKQTYFSAYHISRDTAQNYVDGMIKNKVEYMTGYASANYFLARFIEEEGIKAPKMRAVLTSADKLTPEMRNTFRRVYDCETYDSYNGVEACNLISECEYGTLHIVPDVGFVEVVNEQGNPCQFGETGEVISTGFLNFDQPLIRYKMGDLIRLAENQNCPCGRHMPVVDEIVGRIEDVVVGIDGREMVRFHGIFVNIPMIVEAQVIQHNYKNFEIVLVQSEKLNEESIALIKKRLVSQLGEIEVKFSIVESIPRNANGKFKSVISHVQRKLS